MTPPHASASPSPNSPASAPSSAAAHALLQPWPGPFGGLPPFDHATPEAIEHAFRAALEIKRAELRAIAGNSEAPSFDNTLAAWEDSGRALYRVQKVAGVMTTLASSGDMPAVAQRIAPLASALDDEIAHDAALFARVDAVWRGRASNGLNAEQQRLVEVVRGRMLRAGAALSGADKQQLQSLNARLAELGSRFTAQLMAEQERQAVFIDDESGLAGLSDAQVQAAAAAAAAKGRQSLWAIPCLRPSVWPFLTHSTRRDLREQVWRMWTNRGDNAGEFDNKPLVAEMLKLRGQKARLLGHASYAHLMLTNRMARTPETALAVLMRTWGPVLQASRAQVAEFQQIADAEGAGITLAPWDRLHYAEKLRRARFGLSSDAVRPYLTVEGVTQAMLAAASRLHGLRFEPLPGVPVVHPSCRVYAVHQLDKQSGEQQGGERDGEHDGEAMGVLYLDLFQRPGKGHGSHQQELRSAESFRGRVLPVSMVVSGVALPAPGEPALMTWEYAKVIFHELGHGLHMLMNRSSYPSLGSLAVAWDFVELPALLNESWLPDPELLQRHARHHATGEPIPMSLVNAIKAAAKFDRIFSVNLDFLSGAIVDMKMHLVADGGEVDAIEIERQTLAELGMPAAWDQIMRVPHNMHCFAAGLADGYAAGLYSYLWADVMAADVAAAFAESPGGLYDAATATRYRDTLLTVGHGVPADQAFRNFRGRDPDPLALLRRFGLDAAAASP